MKTFKSDVLLRRIAALEKATIEQSWVKGNPPEKYKEVHKKYQKARLALISYVIEHVL